MRLDLLSAVVVLGLFGANASAATLDRIKESGVIKIAYRADAPPYSYKNASDEPSGYTVDLCRAVSASLKDQMGLQNISIEYVPVTTENRFEMIQNGSADMLCGATTVTLSRRAMIDFSLPTFVDGASVVFRAGGPKNFEELAGKKIGVRAGTTTEESLRNTLKGLKIDAEVVAVSDHADGLKKLEANKISAYFGDQAILLFQMSKSESPEKLSLSKRFFSTEPYAIGLPRGDGDFRLAVDRAISRIYRTGAIGPIFGKNFGGAKPSDVVKALYLISAMPE
jgi:ABC-type amino acid transport substrate-binding protein